MLDRSNEMTHEALLLRFRRIIEIHRLDGYKRQLLDCLLASVEMAASADVLLGQVYPGERGKEECLRTLINATNEWLDHRFPEQGLKAVIVHPSSAKPCRLVLEPTAQFFKERACTWAGKNRIPVWLPIHGPHIEISLNIDGKSWSPPLGFPDYGKHADSCWADHLLKPGREHSFNSQNWSVESFHFHKNEIQRQGLTLNLQRVSFRDIVATTGNLERQVQVDGESITVRALLARNASPSQATRHFIPAANPLLVEVNIICGEQLLLKKDAEKNRWGPPIFGYVDRLLDVSRNQFHMPDYGETAFRLGCQQLRFQLIAERVCWLAAGFGQTEGKVSLLGEIEVPGLPEEIVQAAKEENGYKLINLESSALQQLKAGSESDEEKIRPHFEALIALSLHRRGKLKLKVAH